MSALLAIVAAASAAAPICTDRPAKANAVCTVKRGTVQVETSLASWSLTRAEGVRTEVLSLGSTVFKLGLSEHSDLQAGISPYARLALKDSGSRRRASGLGDLQVRYKRRLTSDGAGAQIGVIPFVKLPTAAHNLGNGKIEGGLAVPISFALEGPVAITLGPEVDLLADADGHGRHPAIVNLINLAGPIGPKLTASAELWSNFNFDEAGTIKQASADAALAYAVSANFQLDAGTNFGLTRASPDIEVYAGASIRF